MPDRESRVIDRAWIVSHIPHQGGMCLLDRVERWDEQCIVCVTDTHRLADNPLRAGNRLGIANAIEYAAQAMAVHGALLLGESEAPKAGYLTSVRDVRWHRDRLDDIAGPLHVSAQRLSGNSINVLYGFEVHADALLLISGRASVVLDVAGLQVLSNKQDSNKQDSDTQE